MILEYNMFYAHVKSWIEAYYHADALDWIRQFINESSQTKDVKDALLELVDKREKQMVS